MARVPMLRGIARDLLRAAAATAVDRLGGEPASALVAVGEELQSSERVCADLREQLRAANDPAKLRSLEALASADADRIKRLSDALAHEVEVGASRAASLAASVQIGKETAEAYAATVARLAEVETALAEERVKSEKGLTVIGGYFPRAEAMVARADAAEARVKQLESDLEKAKSGCVHILHQTTEVQAKLDVDDAPKAWLIEYSNGSRSITWSGEEAVRSLDKGNIVSPLFRHLQAVYGFRDNVFACEVDVGIDHYFRTLIDGNIIGSRSAAEETARGDANARAVRLIPAGAPAVDVIAMREIAEALCGREFQPHALAAALRAAIGEKAEG